MTRPDWIQVLVVAVIVTVIMLAYGIQVLYDIEIMAVLFNGLVIGVVIMLAYGIQKRLESKSAKYHVADVMSDEMKSILNMTTESAESPIMPRNHRIPTQDVYRGLLNSGRIVFFEGQIRRELAQIYDMLGNEPFEVDKARCTRINDELEKIKAANKRYRWIPV